MKEEFYKKWQGGDICNRAERCVKRTGPIACLVCSPFAFGKGSVLWSGILLLPKAVSQINKLNGDH